MSNASRDQNNIPTLLGVSSSDGRTPITVYADPGTHRLLVDTGVTPVAPGGADTNVQYNDSGSFGGDSTFTFNESTKVVGIQQAAIKNSVSLEETGAGTDIITVQAPASIASSYTLTLPVDDGSAGQALSTDGSGVLSWVNASSIPGGFTQGSVIFQGPTNLAQDNSNFFWDNSNNRLGIGTAVPRYPFHIQTPGDSWAFAGFFVSSVDSSDGANYNTVGGNGGLGLELYGTSLNSAFATAQFNMGSDQTINLLIGDGGSAPTSAIYIDSIRNVGIGTTTPVRKLEVNGDFRATGGVAGSYTGADLIVNNATSPFFGGDIQGSGGSSANGATGATITISGGAQSGGIGGVATITGGYNSTFANSPAQLYIRGGNGSTGGGIEMILGTGSSGGQLNITGLPTSSAGLNTGDVWCDTTGGLNVLKIV